MTQLEYGQWATIGVERVMIVDWTETTVTVWRHNERETYSRSDISDVSDFLETDEARKAKGYSY